MKTVRALILLFFGLMVFLNNPISVFSYSSLNTLEMNGGFELDRNSNSLPDFWETVWRNGISTGSLASIKGYEPLEGQNHYRLYNGTGDPHSYMYTLSDPIKIMKGVPYKISASMRYTLPIGDTRITIIETDNNGKNIYETQRSFSNGGWKWNSNSLLIFPKNDTQYIRIRFEVGGEESAYLDIDNVVVLPIDLNEGFENDQNGNTLPDFWETTWRNGTSLNPIASIKGYDPIDDKYHLRLHNGTKDSASYVYILSDPIPVTYGDTYELNAFLRYTLPSGTAVMRIIECDSNNNVVYESGRSMNNGGWKWNYRSLKFTPKWTTSYVRIRLAVGGEEQAILDIDRIGFKLLSAPAVWKEDKPIQTHYYYDLNGRMKYKLMTDGGIIKYEYDNNGSILKKYRL